MRDSYMDCPDRERAQWWGDVVLEMGETFYALDRRSDALSRKGILELMAWQRADSTVYSPVPSTPGHWDAELPTQMLASVGWYGLLDLLPPHRRRRDDPPRVPRRARLPRALGAGCRRLGGAAAGWLDVGRLGRGQGHGAHLQRLVRRSRSRGQREMARLTGHEADISAIDRQLARLATAFERTFWTGSEYRSPGHAGATDDRGHALAVVAGLAPRERYPAIREVLLRERHASPYFEKYVGESLIRMGHTDDALARTKQRYAAMIASPLTTLWEGWGLGAEGFGGGTYNHAWSGGPLTLLSSLVVGVEPLEPGYASFRVAPRPGSLAHARAVVPSVRGRIVAEVRQPDGPAGAIELVVTVPEGTRALVVVPGRRARVELAGETVWTARDGAVAGASAEALGAGPDGVRLWLRPGTWSLAAE